VFVQILLESKTRHGWLGRKVTPGANNFAFAANATARGLNA
jgi:hypothetical protein